MDRPRAMPPEPEALVGLLAEPARLRVVAAIVLGAKDEAEIERTTGLAPRQVRAALDRLSRARLVAGTPGEGLRVAEELFREAARASSAQLRAGKVSLADLGATEEQARVLERFFDDGQLAGVPSQRSKRLVLLDFLAGKFEPGRMFAEREVNRVLRRFHEDVAMLRRLLVDEGFLERREGFYWRAGGSFEVDS